MSAITTPKLEEYIDAVFPGGVPGDYGTETHYRSSMLAELQAHVGISE